MSEINPKLMDCETRIISFEQRALSILCKLYNLLEHHMGKGVHLKNPFGFTTGFFRSVWDHSFRYQYMTIIN